MALAVCQPLGCCAEAEGPVYANCCCVDVDIQAAIKAFNAGDAKKVAEKVAVAVEEI